MGTAYALQMKITVNPAADPAVRRDLDRLIAAANGLPHDDWESGHPMEGEAYRLRDHLRDRYDPVTVGPFFGEHLRAVVPDLDNAVGVRLAGDTLLIGIEAYNFGRASDEEASGTTFDVLFDFLGRLAADAPGAICGRYWVEETETAGPVVRVADGFVASASQASHPSTRYDGYSLGHNAPQERIAPAIIPLDSIRRDPGAGYLVRFDADRIRPLSTAAD